MILEVDAGNTRIKWRLMKGANSVWVKEGEGSVFAKTRDFSAFVADMDEQFNVLLMSSVSRVKVSSVRGEDFRLAFSSWVSEKWGLKSEFASVEDNCSGVNNGYADPSAMGVDRWLAVLAGYNRENAACCIVDCGSAITVDVVDRRGEHQGGYIVPGFAVMQEALNNKSDVLDSSQGCWDNAELGKNTDQAIRSGLVSMVIGLLEGVHKDEEAKGNRLKWFLTGGDACLISPFIQWQHELIADLVMDGLSLAIKEVVEGEDK